MCRYEPEIKTFFSGNRQRSELRNHVCAGVVWISGGSELTYVLIWSGNIKVCDWPTNDCDWPMMFTVLPDYPSACRLYRRPSPSSENCGLQFHICSHIRSDCNDFQMFIGLVNRPSRGAYIMYVLCETNPLLCLRALDPALCKNMHILDEV